MALAYANIGFVHSARGDIEEAVEFHRMALRLQTEIVHTNPTYIFVTDLSGTQRILGTFYDKLGDQQKAIESFEAAAETLETRIESDDGPLKLLNRIRENIDRLQDKAIALERDSD